MPRVPVPEGRPGIGGLMAYKPSTGQPLSALAEAVLRGPSPLTQGERELIAAYVSTGNECRFCAASHSAAAAHAIGDGGEVVAAVCADPESAPVDDKMRALLALAGKVRESGLAVTDADVERARAAGAGDEDIHDAVLVAAAFCMFNRYVDGLRATTPDDASLYDRMGRMLVEQGYVQ